MFAVRGFTACVCHDSPAFNAEEAFEIQEKLHGSIECTEYNCVFLWYNSVKEYEDNIEGDLATLNSEIA